MNCKGQHQLKMVYCSAPDLEDVCDVVRWCEICGAVVVDHDVDGRTYPGGHTDMKLPVLAKQQITKDEDRSVFK